MHVGQPISSEHKPKVGAKLLQFLRIPERAGVDMVILGAVWITTVLLVWPIGNFPLNDDWAFAKTVKHLLETGKYFPSPWAAMPLLTQTFWGALFCLPAGFSFNALRCSTLVMAFGGVLATYFSFRYVNASRSVALLGAFTLAFNPIYYALSNTFMTDVTFTGLMMWSALFLYRNLKYGSRMDWVAGALLALAATLSRQLGLAIPLSFALCLIWMKGLHLKAWAGAIAPLALCVAGLVAYQTWIKSMNLQSIASIKMNLRAYSIFTDPGILLAALKKNFGSGLLYLGWFALPMMVLLFPSIRRMRKKPGKLVGTAFVALAAALLATMALIRSNATMPVLGNILVVQGIGPLTLPDPYNSELLYFPSIGKAFWLTHTAFSILGGALLVAAGIGSLAWLWSLCREFRRLEANQAAGVFFLMSAGAYLFAILALGGMDRYYMPVLPLILVGGGALFAGRFRLEPGERDATGRFQRKIQTAISVSLLGFMAVFSVCGTHDYLNWHRVQWKALDDLMLGGSVTPEDVDGGFEFNGWFLYDPNFKSPKGKSLTWVHRDDYAIAFGEQSGYRVIKEYPFQQWLPFRTGRVLLLGKER